MERAEAEKCYAVCSALYGAGGCMCEQRSDGPCESIAFLAKSTASRSPREIATREMARVEKNRVDAVPFKDPHIVERWRRKKIDLG